MKLRKDFYKEISSQSYRLLIAGIIVLSGVYIGSSFTPTPKVYRVEVKNVSASISEVIEKGIDINVDGEIITLTGEEIKKWTWEYTRDYSGKKDIQIDSTKVIDYIKSIASKVEVEPQDARIQIVGGRADVFQPSVVGKKINTSEAANTLERAIRNGEERIALSIQRIEPSVTLDKVNSLGIDTLLGKGESSFSGSSAARIHNIRVGMNKFNGFILKPGESFSFNDVLGDVDASSGYKPELVIKNKKTVLEYGGGLCQVSTTLFRSAIYAGLPIIERRPHSFPVHYYNPQGFDSTIYPGVTDLKFANNTPKSILIQNKIAGTKLIFEIYGTSDSRTVKVDGPYQYDQKSSGAMKAYFTRVISYTNGEKIEERFDSVYRSPPVPQEKNPLE